MRYHPSPSPTTTQQVTEPMEAEPVKTGSITLTLEHKFMCTCCAVLCISNTVYIVLRLGFDFTANSFYKSSVTSNSY